MASIEDRWFREDSAGNKIPTERNGVGLRWRAHYRTPAGAQRNRSFARKQAAENYLTTIAATKLAGTFVDPSRARVTFREMAAKWTASKVGLRQNTRNRYAWAMDGHVLPRWGDVPIGAIDYEDVQAWVADLVKSGMAAASVRKVFTVFSGVLQMAVKARRLPANPAKGVELPKPRKGDKKYLTVQQVEIMAAAAGRLPEGRPKRATDRSYAQYRLVVLTLAYCAPRWSEMAALRVGSVDRKRRRFKITHGVVELDGGQLAWDAPKSDQSRWAPIPDFLWAELEPHLAGKPADDLLFTSPTGGVLRNRNARRDWFDDAAKAAGAPGLTPHELRHTAASLAVSAGANIKALQRMFGHESAAMTLNIYAELFDDDLDAVAAGLNALRARSVVAPALPQPETLTGEDAG